MVSLSGYAGYDLRACPAGLGAVNSWTGVQSLHHIDLFRHLLAVVDPRHLSHDDRVALINLIGACLAVDKLDAGGQGLVARRFNSSNNSTSL